MAAWGRARSTVIRINSVGGVSGKWLVLSAVSVGTFMATLNTSIVNVSLPTIARDFGVAVTEVEWVVIACLSATGVLILTFSGGSGTSSGTAGSTPRASRSSYWTGPSAVAVQSHALILAVHEAFYFSAAIALLGMVASLVRGRSGKKSG